MAVQAPPLEFLAVLAKLFLCCRTTVVAASHQRVSLVDQFPRECGDCGHFTARSDAPINLPTRRVGGVRGSPIQVLLRALNAGSSSQKLIYAEGDRARRTSCEVATQTSPRCTTAHVTVLGCTDDPILQANTFQHQIDARDTFRRPVAGAARIRV